MSSDRIDVIINLIKEIQDNIKEIEKTQVRHDISLQSIEKLEKKDKELSDKIEKIEAPIKTLQTLYSWAVKILAIAGTIFACKELILKFFKD